MVKKAIPKAKARPKTRARPKAEVSGKYGYLPPDLQRAGQHMERVAFLRNLQKSIADQNYVRAFGASSGLSENGAVGLKEKVATVAAEIAKPRSALLPVRMRTPSPHRRPARDYDMPPLGPRSSFKIDDPRGRSERPRSRSRRVSAAAGSSSQPMRYDPDTFNLL